ncbi:MAG: pyrroloquinoline quinone biosynthesis protein PqqB [Rhodospirillaceae bacterium]|nr:pyrroloquinoline quinone biosynthesis protein PqqB [Rhodospirillaceae bacterium]
MLRLIVLGSAAGGGFPQWNSNDAASQRARAGDPQALPRSQASLAVTADDRRWVILNASPDLRQQINDTPALHPRHGKRDSPIAAVVLTGGDIDNIAGLLTLRESHPLALYATARILAILAANSVFNVLDPRFVARRAMALDAGFEVADRDGRGLGLRIEPFAVPGKVPLYAEDPTAGEGFGTQPEDTVGLKVAATDGASSCFYYVPGCAAMTPELAARLRGAPLVLFDGTLWRDDEMIAAGVGTKTGKRMGHMSIAGPDGTIAAFAPLGVARKIFIHVNNTNPVLLGDTPERAEAAAAGWEVAHDGLEIRL